MSQRLERRTVDSKRVRFFLQEKTALTLYLWADVVREGVAVSYEIKYKAELVEGIPHEK